MLDVWFGGGFPPISQIRVPWRGEGDGWKLGISHRFMESRVEMPIRFVQKFALIIDLEGLDAIG